MALKLDHIYSADTLRIDMERILDLYKAAGHFLTEVKATDIRYSEDSSSVNFTLQIDEGARLRIGTIGLDGNSRFPSTEILNRLTMHQGSRFSAPALEEDIARLLEVYGENGYPFSQVQPGRFRLSDTGSVDLLLHIQEGPGVWIKSIRVSGNEITRDHVIVRETRLKKGDIYRQSKIDAARTYLERLGIFSEVSMPVCEQIDTDSVEITLQVKEGKTSSISGVLGYNPPRGTSDGYVTGRIDVAFGNLFGAGRKVKARWHRYDPFSSDLGFEFEEPWIAGLPITATLGIGQTDQDSSYVLTQSAGTVGYRLTDRLSGRLLFGWERLVPDSSGGASLARSTRHTAAVRAAYDTRDQATNPREGLYYQTEITYGRKRNSPTSLMTPEKTKVRTTTFVLDLEHFVPTFSRQAIAVALHGREFRSGEKPVPVSEHFRLGGATTLRGYRENQFSGTRLAWSNIEYRFLPTSQSRVYLFCDVGTYYREQLVNADTGETKRTDGFKFGYGFGIRLQSRLGLVGIDFGLGEGDTFSQGKIHVRLENQF